MNRNSWFTLFVCIAILQGYEANKRQNERIKACEENVQEMRNWLVAKFPPEKWQQVDALERVMLWGRQLQAAIKDIPAKDRGLVAFQVADLEDHYGPCLPRWLGLPYTSDGKLANISFLFRNLASESRYLDYEGSADFLNIAQPYFADFPQSLKHYLDDIVLRKLGQLQEVH